MIFFPSQINQTLHDTKLTCNPPILDHTEGNERKHVCPSVLWQILANSCPIVPGFFIYFAFLFNKIKLAAFAYTRLLNKPYENEVF